MFRFAQHDTLRNSSAKLGRILFSIASANVGYCGVQPNRRSLALLTRLLLSPRLPCCFDLPIGGAVAFPLQNRLIVNDVVNLRGLRFATQQ